MADKIQIRQDIAANWTTNNPTMAQGEYGLETDTRKVKLGDGSTAWNSLNYGVILPDVTETVSVGYAHTPFNAGTQSSGTFTPDEADGAMQFIINGGAHTLAPPVNNCSLCIQYTNNASAGAITTSGFTKVTGDTLTTVNGDDFFIFITKHNGFSHMGVVALQ